MIRWFRSLFAWRFVKVSGAWEYSENAVSGRRSAHNVGGHSPLDWDWLLEGMVYRGMPLIDGFPAWKSRYRNSLPDGWYWA